MSRQRRLVALLAGLLAMAVMAAACGEAARAQRGPDAPHTPGTPGAAAPAEVDAGAAVIRPVDPGTPRLPATVPAYGGGEVEVTDVSRILPLSGAIAEVVFSLGFGDRVVGRDVETTFPEAAHLPLVTHAHDVSAEGALSLRPTLVLVDARTGPPEALQAIAATGVPVVQVPEAWTLEDAWPRMRAIAAALGVPAAGEALVERTRAEIDAAAGAPAGAHGGPAPTVAFLYLRGTAGVYLLGGDGSGADALIEAVGGIDAGSKMGLGPYTPLTSEALAAAAPDALVVMRKGLESVGGMDGLLDVAGVAQTPAGRDGRVVVVEDGALLAFGPQTPAVIAQLREGLAAPAGGAAR